MNSTDWWHRQLRIIQYNLQMKDTPQMDAEKIARETAEMGGNAVVINAADSVVWYHTAVKHQRVNPYLPEGRDILRELIDAFHKRGIKVFARGAFMGLEEETYYQRPEWVQRNADGSPVMLGNERPGEWFRLYRPCPNSGFMHEGGGLDVGVEVFRRYDFDGAFWLGGSTRGGNCWCDTCKKRYFEKYGREMPDDPALIEKDWNLENSRRKAVQFKEALLAVKPDMPFLRYYWPFDLDIGVGFVIPADDIDLVAHEGNTLCTEAQDVLSLGVKRLPDWNTPALRMKMGRTIEGFPPPVGIIHACPGMDWRHTCMPRAEFLYWAAQIPANGGSYWTTFTGYPDTIPDKRMFQTIRDLNHMIDRVEEDMCGAGSDCQVLLLSDGGVYVQGWAEALMCAHIDYDMLAQYQLCAERIAAYPVVIVPKDFGYDEAAGAVLAEYVENGGHLIVEGTSELALRHVRGLLGVEGVITASEEMEATYLRIEPEAESLQALIGDCELIPLRGRAGFCHAAPGSRVLATWVPAFSSAATAGFPPERASLPRSHTDIPLCTVSTHGRGEVMFLSYEPSRMIKLYALQDMYTMIAGYVDFMLGERRMLSVSAPSRVMTTVFAGNNTHMIHFVNGIGQRPLQDTIPCFDLTVDLKLQGRRVASVVSRIADVPVEYSVADGVLHIRLSRLDAWDMLLIQYA